MAKKLQLTYKEIEDRLRVFRDKPIQKEDIGYTLLWAFGKPEREIERYREGKGIIKTFDGLLVKGLLCYKASTTLQFANELEVLKTDAQIAKSAPKIIAVSDGITIRAYDTRERNTFEQKVARLFCDFEFFYPLAGVERVQYVEEAEADMKAAEKLAKLHDEIRAYNEFTSDSDLHDINTFIARLLFCFFAEDTGIFRQGVFTHAIQQYTIDARNLKEVLEQIFRYMGGKPIPEGVLRTYCEQSFAYVGGGLFDRDIYIPQLSNRARTIIIDSGELDWQNINPDIFGSMIQAVVNPDVRANQGMHYTSVPNIMKVINPLFLDELRQEHDNITAQLRKLREEQTAGVLNDAQYWKKCKAIDAKCDDLLVRMSRMKFFDPACGSGNFLIITYKMLRNLEMEIFNTKKLCTPHGALPFIDSMISLQQFYGIELLDFPHEVAMLSLWLAEHQMNKKMNDYFGVNKQALPLKDINNIHCGNACRIDWNDVCPHTKEEEVFVFGNPPYLGSSRQEPEQKKDMDRVFESFSSYKTLDYISIWFYKAALFINKSNSEAAFVSTNSITQGGQVEILWKKIFDIGVIIRFAYKSFRWNNNAKNKAVVTCVIVGLSTKNNAKRIIYENEAKKYVDNINGYLSESNFRGVVKRNTPISEFPEILKGSMPNDGGYLLFDSLSLKEDFVTKAPQAKRFVKELLGSNEFIKGIKRFCLWIPDDMKDIALGIPEIAELIEKCKTSRLNSEREATRKQALKPWAFGEIRYKESSYILIPEVSSEKRTYMPVGYIDSGIVHTNKAFAVYNGGTYMFGVLSSSIHVLWTKFVSGKLETRISYSSLLCYNTFPFPQISDAKRAEIEEAATDILLTREPYLTMGKTLADLYDPDTMPQDLKAAHERLDGIVESCYPGAPFASDEERLECLFKLYEKMTNKK